MTQQPRAPYLPAKTALLPSLFLGMDFLLAPTIILHSTYEKWPAKNLCAV